MAVPTTVPLAHTLPMLLRFAVPERDEDGGGWVLSRLDGSVLDAARTPMDQGVREGDVLVLRSARERVAPPLYDDVVEVIGAEAVGTRWDATQTRTACGVLSVLTTLGAATAIAVSNGMLGGILGVVIALLLLAGGAALARAVSDVPAATVAASLAAPIGAVGVVRLLSGPWGAAHLLLASAVVLTTAVLGAMLVGGGDAAFAAIAVPGIYGLVGGLVAVLFSVSAVQTAALVAPLALACVTALPTLALRLARLPKPQLPRSASDIAEVLGQVAWEQTSAQVAQARRMLSGLVTGVHVVIAVGIVVLALGGGWAQGLAVVLAFLVALRARLFRERAQVLAPVLTAAVALISVSVGVSVHYAGEDSTLLGIVLPVLLVVALCIGLAGVVHGRRPPSPRAARMLDIVELLLLLAVVPVALAVWDVYAALLDLAA